MQPMSRELRTDEIARLETIAEHMFPIEDNMCVNCRIGQRNKRIAFVWQMKKQLRQLSENNLKTVLNELERAAGIKSAVPTVNNQVGE